MSGAPLHKNQKNQVGLLAYSSELNTLSKNVFGSDFMTLNSRK